MKSCDEETCSTMDRLEELRAKVGLPEGTAEEIAGGIALILDGMSERIAELTALSESRYDCHAGPGTCEHACGGCVSCITRRIVSMETALREAGEKFREYERMHVRGAALLRKTHDRVAAGRAMFMDSPAAQECDAGAKANAAMAEMCERALAGGER
jgi:hypothetical protein